MTEARVSARRERAPVAATSEKRWQGWALLREHGGWRRVRVSLPDSVVRAHAVGEVSAVDTRQSCVGAIEADLVSDRFATGHRWGQR